jgi:DNA-binding NtrC family response regulator
MASDRAMRVLLVDDDSEIVHSFLTALQIMGHEVKGFSSPKAALEHFANHPRSFDLVITDFTMSEMRCPDFVHGLRSIRKGIPVFLCTGNAEHEIQDAAARLEIRSVLYKPFSYEGLESFMAAIARQLD